MTETPNHDREVELVRQYHTLRGEADGRRAVLAFEGIASYCKAFAEQIQRAGLAVAEVRDEEFHADPDRYAALVAELARLDSVASARIAERPSGDLSAWYARGVRGAVRSMRIVAGLDQPDVKPCPCDQFCRDEDRCDGLTTREAVARLNDEGREEHAEDGDLVEPRLAAAGERRCLLRDDNRNRCRLVARHRGDCRPWGVMEKVPADPQEPGQPGARAVDDEAERAGFAALGEQQSRGERP